MNRLQLGWLALIGIGGCLPIQPPPSPPPTPMPVHTSAAKVNAAPPVTEASVDEHNPHQAAQALAEELRRERKE
jgi:hypothetical protein